MGKKRAFLIHGWDGSPKEAWFPWLKEELEERGFEVYAPQMPNAAEPHIDTWVPFLKSKVGLLTRNDYFVGHSIGCQAILRYLIWEAQHENEEQAGGVILVAPFTHLKEQETRVDNEIAKEWTETPLYFDALNPFSTESYTRYVAIFSNNDPEVTQDNIPPFEDGLEADVIVLRDRGHFAEDDGIKELPEVVEAIERMA